MIFVTQKKSVYVDSVAGSDANDGLTQATPKATCAAGMAVLASSGRKTIRLKCGSFFREQITLPAGKRLMNYGSGDRPILDCRDVITGTWTKTAGYTNVYERTVPHGIYVPTSPANHRVWENNVRLIRTGSLSACDSTAGSFYSAIPSGVLQTLYVHTTDTADPTSNGRQYEYAPRMYGAELSDYCVIDGIDTKCNPSKSGSIRALARGCIIRNCKASDGYVHNVLISDGVCENVFAYDAEPLGGVGTQTAFVSYNAFTAGSTPPSVIYRKCRVEMPTFQSLAMFAWYSHGSINFSKIVFEDCSTDGVSYAFGGINCPTFVISRCASTRTKFFVKAEYEADFYLYRSRFVGTAEANPNESFLNGIFKKAYVRHCEYLSYSGTISPARSTPSTLDVRFSTINRKNSGVSQTIMYRPTDQILLRNNIIFSYGVVLSSSEKTLPSGMDSNYNLVYSTQFPTGENTLVIMGNWGAWKTWSQWKTDTGQDTNSVFTNPQRISEGDTETFSTFDPTGPVFTSGFPVGVQPTDDAETLALLASVGYTP